MTASSIWCFGFTLYCWGDAPLTAGWLLIHLTTPLLKPLADFHLSHLADQILLFTMNTQDSVRALTHIGSPAMYSHGSASIASFCVASLFSSSNKLVVFSQFFSHVWMNLQYVSTVKAVSYTNLNIQYSDRVFLWSVSANDWHGNRLSTFEMSNRKNKKIISRKAFSLHPLSRILGKALMWVVEVFELLRLNK